MIDVAAALKAADVDVVWRGGLPQTIAEITDEFLTETVIVYENDLPVERPRFVQLTGSLLTAADVRFVCTNWFIAHLKTTKKQQAVALLTQKIAAGITYEGQNFQIDEASQNRMTAVGLEATLSILLQRPWTVKWRNASNQVVEFNDPNAFLTFATACAHCVKSFRESYWTIVDAINVAETVEDLLLINPMEGWP